MSPLNSIATKALQITGLRTVRTAAVLSFRQLNEEEKRMRRLFPQLKNQRQQRGNLHLVEEQVP